jgi:EmrB/QacA subfamily drug resistance transporter
MLTTSPSTVPAAPTTPSHYHWWVTASVMIGAFIVIVDGMIVNIALPKIMSSFGVDVLKIRWVATSYMLASAVMMPATGWLGQRFGNKTLYLLCLGLFIITSGLCGAAWSVDSLIFFRVIQGMSGGVLMPLSMAIMFQVFPEDKRALGVSLWGLGASLGPAIGPTLGGYLTEYLNWRFIFYVNLPVGTIGLLCTWLILRPSHREAQSPFDPWGFFTMATFLVALLLALSDGQREGWQSSYILTLFAIFAVGFMGFVAIELWQPHPLVDLRLFANPTFTMGILLGLGLGITAYGSTFLIPLFTENILDYSVLRSGVAMLPGALVVLFCMPLIGWLTDRTDARYLIVAGTCVFIVFTYYMSRLDPRVTFWTIALYTVLRGAGLGCVFPPWMARSLKTIPLDKSRMASGMLNVTIGVGASFGIAIMATLLERYQIFRQAIYTEEQWLSAPGTQFALTGLQGLAIKLGHIGWEATSTAHFLLQRLVAREALIGAFNDCFVVLGLVALTTIIPTLFLTDSRVKKHRSLLHEESYGKR